MNKDDKLLEAIKTAMNASSEAWNKYGSDEQLFMLIEEAAELIQAVNKLKRAEPVNFTDALNSLIEEIADVLIVALGLIAYTDTQESFGEWLLRKIYRLKFRMGNK